VSIRGKRNFKRVCLLYKAQKTEETEGDIAEAKPNQHH
jgi:hypothetical protein